MQTQKARNLAKIVLATLAAILISVPAVVSAGGGPLTFCSMKTIGKTAPVITADGNLFKSGTRSYYVFDIKVADDSCLGSLKISLTPETKYNSYVYLAVGQDLFDINGKALANTGSYSAKYSTSGLTKGDYAIKITATDAQGNITNKLIRFTVK